MAVDTKQDIAVRELAERSGDGITVWLVWYAGREQLTVVVADEKEGSGFSFDVGAARALDAFAHPFAYAAALDRAA
jgi:hypothetical protein